MLIRWGALSDTGVLRVQNEDSMLAEEGLFAVADGMGGHNAGEVASAMAINMLRTARAKGIADANEFAEIIRETNKMIFRSAADETGHRGMGTTLTALAFTPTPKNSRGDTAVTATVVNIGDSRTYLLRGGEFRQVSVDHSYVQELVNEGLISRDEARTHVRRNVVTRALGIDASITIDSWTLPLLAGDRYVLCSDGLVDEVPDVDIDACLRRINNPQEVAKELVAMANRNGGRDNVTVIVVDVLADDDTASASTDRESLTESSPASDQTQTQTPTRLIVRRLIVAGAVAVAMVVAIVLVATYARTGYFVAYENSQPDARVLIYRGKSGYVLWLGPTIEADSTLTRADLSAGLAKEIAAKPTFGSALDAQKYVNQIRDVVESVKPVNPTSTTISTTPAG